MKRIIALCLSLILALSVFSGCQGKDDTANLPVENDTQYLDLMEKVLTAYSKEGIKAYLDEVKAKGITEHGFPRLTANMGILIANNRTVACAELFPEMMELCCQKFLEGKAANDFSVREIICCLMELEKAGLYPEETKHWRTLLGKIQPDVCYSRFAKHSEDVNVGNWGLYTAVSEYMRQYIGVANTAEFVDLQIPTQTYWLDENGMYQDPGTPIVYDYVCRALFAFLLHYGYDGKYTEEIDESLKKAGLLMLDTISLNGEIPYGGRSNQFLFNEALCASLCEFEANRYYREGNLELAGQFKTASNLCLSSISQWLDSENISHIKNKFPVESEHGCEDYAYFDKYMVTTASFLYIGYTISNKLIQPVELAQTPNVTSMSPYFHKTFLKNADCFVEVDYMADKHYDSSGIGRVQFKGVPSALCLSVPGTKNAEYSTGEYEQLDFAIAVGIKQGQFYDFGLDTEDYYSLKDTKITDSSASATFDCELSCGISAQLDCKVEGKTVTVSGTSKGNSVLMLPIFHFDGQEYTEIETTENTITVRYDGYVCTYTTNGKIVDLAQTGANRNGVYKLFCAENSGDVTVEIQAGKAS